MQMLFSVMAMEMQRESLRKLKAVDMCTIHRKNKITEELAKILASNPLPREPTSPVLTMKKQRGFCSGKWS